MTENHFGPSAVNVITKTCSGEIRTVSQAQETKVHKIRSDFAVLVSQSSSLQETKVFQRSGTLDLGGVRAMQVPSLAEQRLSPGRGGFLDQMLNNV